MNFKEMSEFVRDWTETKNQKFGWIYGYFCEDPDYELGIRAIIEAIYEPPIKADSNTYELLDDFALNDIEVIAKSLGLQRIGWIFTSENQNEILTSKEIINAAKLQNDFLKTHYFGYKVPKFLTVVMRRNKMNSNVQPEVYMVSDHFSAMVRDDVILNINQQTNDSLIKFKNCIEDDNIPEVKKNGKRVFEIEPEFFIISVPNGQPVIRKWNIFENYDFQVENRSSTQTTKKLKEYFIKNKKELGLKRFANFHLLIH